MSNRTKAKLLYREFFFGPSGKGTPGISFGDTAAVMCFANLSGAYNGYADIERARADFKHLVDAGNDADALRDELKRCHRLLAVAMEFDDGDVFGVHHNDAVDSMQNIEKLVGVTA